MKRLAFIVCLLWTTIAHAQLIGPGAGGSSFNPASPGAIGGTTPSTGTFTALTSGTAGTADPAIQLNTSSGSQSCIDFKGGALDFLCDTASSGVEIATGATARFFVLGAGQGPISGSTFQSSGGVIPTVTCSGGSTGTSVTAGSTNNRGSFISSSSASTNCTLTWSASGTWFQAPFCYFFDAGASITPSTYSMGTCGTATCVVDFASTTSKTIGYLCM